MNNKLMFKIIRFLRKLGIKPEDIALDTENEKAMAELAKILFAAILSLPELEDEYYDIILQVYECEKEEAEEKSIFEIVPHIIGKLKQNANFSFGALVNTK